MPNPYIHLTSSATLPFLPKTNFSLCDLNTLLYTYKIAPMAGEITLGGTEGIYDKGCTAFAVLTENKQKLYHLDALLKAYGSHKWQQTLFSETDIENEIKRISAPAAGGIVFNIKAFIVILLRHQQMRVLPSLSPSTIDIISCLVINEVSLVIRKMIANYAVARYVKLDFANYHELLVSYDEKLFNIHEHLPENFLSLSDIEQLSIMKKIPLTDGIIIEDWNLREKDEEPFFSEEVINYNLSLALKFSGHRTFIEDILQRVKKYNYELDVESIKLTIEATLKNMIAAKSLLESCINNQLPMLELTSDEKDYITNPFPIAFLLYNDNLLEDCGNYEYRSKTPLVLGKDIKIIATEEKHLDCLKKFCAQYGALNDVLIQEIDQLRTKSKHSSLSMWQPPVNEEEPHEKYTRAYIQ